MDIKRTNVLLVEDDPAVCRLIRRILSRAGQNFRCTLKTASTVSNAINQLRKRRFDNVLLDLGLSGSNGLETVDRIRTSSPDVPIIVLTATTDRDVQVEAIKRGADDYLIKSKAFCESLGEHIQYVIQHKKAIEALRHGCEYFRSIVENAPCAIVCISPEGRILEFNACAQDLWKREREEVTGKSFLQTCVERGERFNVYVDLRKALAGEPVKGASTTIAREEGRSDSLLWDFSPMRTDGASISGVIAIARESTAATVRIGNRLPAMKLTSNSEFNDTVETIMTSLAAILEKIEKINSRADPDTLKQLVDNMLSVNCEDKQTLSRKAAVVERLVLSLITADPTKPDNTANHRA
jgi:PAS domain S-box-containing protein